MRKWVIEEIGKELKVYLDKGIKVIIESGACNDCITGYSASENDTVFYTTNCVFPKEIKLGDFEQVSYDDCLNKFGAVFVQVY